MSLKTWTIFYGNENKINFAKSKMLGVGVEIGAA
jgi:hypothetical protein